MLYKATFLDTLGETRIELASNSYSDAWPMLRYLSFRKLAIDPAAQSLPLACAILSRSYCGEVFEFSGMKIGADYADAIRLLLGPQTNIAYVDGYNRTFSTGEIDVAVGPAGGSPPPIPVTGAAPLARVDWSGDFVDPRTRSSAGFEFGAVHTNAAFFASEFAVSVAVGLLFGRDRCGKLFVSPPASDQRELDLLDEALRVVGITLVATNSSEAKPGRSRSGSVAQAGKHYASA